MEVVVECCGDGGGGADRTEDEDDGGGVCVRTGREEVQLGGRPLRVQVEPEGAILRFTCCICLARH